MSVTSPSFPNVPSAPGVPPVARNGTNPVVPTPAVLTGDSAAVATAAAAPGQYGIYNTGGVRVITPDSFKSLDYKQSWRLPNYPMEQGAFQSYNKVQLPFENRVVLVKGGDLAARTAFLDSIEAAANSIDLYNIDTPEETYENVSIEHYDYQRTATNGVTLLTVEIGFLEIRVAPTAAFSSTATPSGAGQVNGGTTQTTTPTGTQVSQVQDLGL